MNRAGIVLMLAVVLIGCGALIPGATPGRTWIGIHAPANRVLPEDMSLEVDGSAWTITQDGGPGVVTPQLNETAEARLVGTASCRLYAGFEAAPGKSYEIRFEEDDSVTVNDITGQAIEMGPGLGEGAPSGCPTLPRKGI